MKIRYLFAGLLLMVLLVFLVPRFLLPGEEPKEPSEMNIFFPGGKGVDIEALIALEFDTPPDPDSLDGRFIIHPEVPGQVTVDGERVVFIPDVPLAYDTRYLVTLTEGVRDLVGNILEHPFEGEFITKPKPPLTIFALGNIFLDAGLNEGFTEFGPPYPFGHIKDMLNGGDVVFANVAGPVSDLGTPLASKEHTFRATPSFVESLGQAGINLVSLANAHSMDYGQEAMQETMALLTESGLRHAGTGKDIEEAHEGAILEVEGYKVALLAYTDAEAVSSRYRSLWQAGEEAGGTAFTDDPKRITADIEGMRAQADLVLVSFHFAASEDGVTLEQEELARLAVDAGAAMVFGHHAQGSQGVDIYKGAPILYNLGNVAPCTLTGFAAGAPGFIFQAEYQAGSVISAALIPLQGEKEPYVPKGEELAGALWSLEKRIRNDSLAYESKEGLIHLELD